MAKKNSAPASPTQLEAPVKKQLELKCLHYSCAGQAHGEASVECEPWEIAVYLLVHHVNHEGHKTEVRIDGLEYHRLPSGQPASALPSSSSETATTAPASGATFRWGL